MLLDACATVSTEVSVAEWFERGALYGLSLKFICGNLELCTIRVPGDTTHHAAVYYNCN
jgi:hypothetical protein